MGSYIHDATQIVFSGTFGHDTKKQRAQQYEIKITDLDKADTNLVWANRNFTLTGFKVGNVVFLVNLFKKYLGMRGDLN